MGLTNEGICRVCHEANRALCSAMGDDSQPPYSKAPKSSHVTMMENVRAVQSGQVKTPSELHQRWVERKLKDGWTLGPRKDLVAKTHPLLVPYDKLHPKDQAKDILFLAIVKGLS